MQHVGDKEYVDIGYGFAKKYWKLGYATEVVKALIDYSQNSLRLPMLVALIEKNNAASIRVAQKAGFEFWKNDMYNGQPLQIYKVELKKD